MPKTAPVSRAKPIRTHNLLGKPDYVPRVVWGKVTNVLRVPEVQPSEIHFAEPLFVHAAYSAWLGAHKAPTTAY